MSDKEKDKDAEHAAESQIVELKLKKTKDKTRFTRMKNKLKDCVYELDDETMDHEAQKQLCKEHLDKVEEAMDEVVNSLQALCMEYKHQSKTVEMKNTMTEIEKIEKSYEEIVKDYNDAMCDNEDGVSEHSESMKSKLGKDMWQQLKRVNIPVFAGEKRKYESWKASFMGCIDSAPSTSEYKLLQLRQYLSGDALKCIDNLGHSAASYEAAKERLDRKYGGQRRQVMAFLEELEKFPAMKVETAASIEKFADLLDIAVINLKENDQEDDLKHGSLYFQLLRKIPETMLTRYNRYIQETSQEESVETLKTWINKESMYYVAAAETIHGLGILEPWKNRAPHGSKSFFGSQNTEKRKQKCCKMCSSDHDIWTCSAFKDLSPAQRWEKAKEFNLCFRCLGTGHSGYFCNRMKVCGINNCNKNHNRLLHSENENLPKLFPQNNSSKSLDHQTHTGSSNHEQSQIALRTIPVVLKHGNRQMTVNALLDDGSSKTYVNSDVAAQLGLNTNTNTRKITVNVMNGRKEQFDSSTVTIMLESINGQVRTSIDACTTKNVTGNLQTIDWNQHSANFKHLREIQFPVFSKKTNVDLLIGVDYANLHCSLHEIRGEPGEPIARLTPLGWTCIGPVEKSTHENYHTFFLEKDVSLEKSLEQFWEIENVRCESGLSVVDRAILQEVKSTMKCSGKHYEVSIPWNEKKQLLQNNYESAFNRLKNTEKRLNREPKLLETYSETINKYVKKGYVRKMDSPEKEQQAGWYLPHFPVIRPDKETTKVRIVFDAAAKHQGISLNDAIHSGPKLQNELFDVLLRFRKNPVSIVCDIEEMYLQVRINENDRPFHRFLWNSSVDPPEQYEFSRLVFGVNASPFLAQYVAQQNAQRYAEKYPLAAETVLKSTYMDDSMDSAASEEEAIELYKQLQELWGKAGMFARKWYSNSAKVRSQIPESDLASVVNLTNSEMPSMKALGVTWLADEDCFVFRVKQLEERVPLTKRIILSKISSIFDPHGFVAPWLIRAKVMIQELWLEGLEWDELVPASIAETFWNWLNEMKELEEIRVPRCLRAEAGSESQITLHAFGDASEKAYGAVVYARSQDKNDETLVRVVASKSRVAPLKSVSIPRLELLAAVLSLKLTATICGALSINVSACTFWTDSLNVLHWVRNRSRNFKPFVANRIGEIQQGSKPAQWRHVPGKQNPADLVSRGSSITNLKDNELWWKGPDYLNEDESQWPTTKPDIIVDSASEMKKSKQSDFEIRTMFSQSEFNVNTHQDEMSTQEWKLEPTRFSSWSKLVRVYAWVLRFIENCKRVKEKRLDGELTVSEIHDTEVRLIVDAQKRSFKDEYENLLKNKAVSQDSKLAKLNPKLDSEGVIRSDSRLKYSEMISYDCRFPIILPRNDYVTELIVRQFHIKGEHNGTNYTLSLLSTQYWILSAREVIRIVENKCTECRRRKAKPCQQIMAPLHAMRTSMPLRAFAHTAVDYGGPFLTVQGRGKVRQKRYLCLFTCMTTRAVHLEMAYGLDTSSFLNAFYRFVGRRGLPVKMCSDNGTNFVGAEAELKSLVKKLDEEQINMSTANKGIEWNFNPPLAPHWGGAHEIMIKAAKRAIYSILGKADVRDEELLTAFIGAESLINSRPLTYQTANPGDCIPITPNHFLFGQMGGEFAPESVDTTAYNPASRWRRVQELMRHFWHRWLKEWLPTLSKRSKWVSEQPDLEVDDVVIVVQHETPRGHWPLGRVVKVHKGRDNHVRAAVVVVGNKEITRPITRLCPLRLNQCK